MINAFFRRFVLVIALFSPVLSGCLAQEVPETVKRNGEKYYVHEVEKGQTLFAISKKYSVTVEDIKKANPDIEVHGLKIGQTILIPHEAMDRRKFKKSDISIDDDHLIHEVQRKETLYSLSKRYNLEIEEIEAANPEIKERGLQPGMKLRIPYAQSEDAQPDVMQPARYDTFMLHVVRKKETLYSISKQYRVSIDSIQILNNGLPGGLKEGMTIRIPILRDSVPPVPEFDSVDDFTPVVRDTFDDEQIPDSAVDWVQMRPFEIAIILPFESHLTDTLKKTFKEGGELKLSSFSKASLDIYRGFQIALDSLAKKGFAANVHVYDSKNSLSGLKALFADSLPKFDMVFGPLLRSHFEWFADTARIHGTPVISPVPLPTKILLGKPNAVKTYPGTGTRLIRLSYHVVDHYADSNLVFWNSGRYSDRELVEIARKHSNICAQQLGLDSLTEMSLYTPSKQRMRTLFDDSTHYTLYVPTKDQAYVSEMLTSLYDLAEDNSGTGFTIFGLSEWAEFDNLETKVMERLNVHFPTVHFYDYERSNMREFISRYRDRYNTDPPEFALQSFDASFYFMSLLRKHGPGTLAFLEISNEEMIVSKFDFLKPARNTGYENQGFYIYRIRNFKKQRVH